MLNITRYSREELLFQVENESESEPIGIKIKVSSIGKKKGRKVVSLSIQAPESVSIMRAELLAPEFKKSSSK